jgi:hypothetical protein
LRVCKNTAKHGNAQTNKNFRGITGGLQSGSAYFISTMIIHLATKSNHSGNKFRLSSKVILRTIAFSLAKLSVCGETVPAINTTGKQVIILFAD